MALQVGFSAMAPTVGSALLPHRAEERHTMGTARKAALSTVAVCVVATALALVVTSQSPAQPVVLYAKKAHASKAATQKLSDFQMSGSFEIPEHPPGMPYIKAPPMGDVQLTDGYGNPIGHVNMRTAPAPPAPPPTIIKFGDVGVTNAECPMCPVLDVDAVKKQKKELAENAHRIERLKHKEEVNRNRIETTIAMMKKLKNTMYDKVFAMKEELKKSDALVEMKMEEKENSTGPVGPSGPPGFDGENGLDGHDGEDGIRGPKGRQGPEGPIGPTGLRGITGPSGPEGSQGPVGPKGKDGPPGPAGEPGPEGPASVTLECIRIGGKMFKGVCFKSSVLEANSDSLPDDCKAYQPHDEWSEADWWKLAQMFHTQPMTPNIDRGHHGGRCSNFEAVTSFTQNLNAVEVWVNSKTFGFTPTGTGQSCDLQGDESSMAVYACAL